MYVLTTGAATNYAYPDTCNTVVGSATSPITYPNTSYTSVASPYSTTLYIECGPVVTMTSYDTISSGDEAGTVGGTVSVTIIGQTMYTSGCSALYVDCSLAQRYCSVTGQNCLGTISNTVGSCISPSQYIVYGMI